MTNGGFDRRDPPEPRLSGIDPAARVQRIVEAAEQAAAQIRDEAEAEARRYLEEYKQRVDELVSERLQLTDTLAEQTGRVKDQYDKFISTLDTAMRRVSEIAGNGQLEADAREDLRAPEPPPVHDREIGPDPLAPPDEERTAAREAQERERPPAPADARQPERRRSIWPPWRSQATPRFENERDVRPQPEPGAVRGASGTTRGGYRPRSSSQGERLLARQMLAAGSSRAEIEARLRDEFGIADAGALIDELDSH